jgi:RNA polymerase sigma factor (sigma-70 family)
VDVNQDAVANRREWLAQEFEHERSHLRAVAYRMLGSVTEADDAVQEAWSRLDRRDPGGTENLRGWLTVVVGRICLDMLRARKARRESFAGDWLPEPIVRSPTEPSPEEDTVMADSVGLALLVVLETLNPAERLAFVLHDVFGVPFEEISEIVGREPAAARQLASRARRRVREAAPEPDADLAVQRRAVDAFLAAARAGDFEALLDVLDPDVVFRVHAAEGDPRAELPTEGAEQVAERILTRGRPFAPLALPAIVNGAPGVVAERDGKRLGVMACTVSNGRIVTMDLVIDPDRFAESGD